MANQNISETFPYDCAFEFVASNNVKRIGLFERDTATNKLREYNGYDDNYYRVCLLDEIDDFKTNGIENCQHLKGLKNLRLDLRMDYVINLPIGTFKKPVVLVHIKYFMNSSVLYRYGMKGIFGIEKVLNILYKFHY